MDCKIDTTNGTYTYRLIDKDCVASLKFRFVLHSYFPEHLNGIVRYLILFRTDALMHLHSRRIIPLRYFREYTGEGYNASFK